MWISKKKWQDSQKEIQSLTEENLMLRADLTECENRVDDLIDYVGAKIKRLEGRQDTLAMSLTMIRTYRNKKGGEPDVDSDDYPDSDISSTVNCYDGNS